MSMENKGSRIWMSTEELYNMYKLMKDIKQKENEFLWGKDAIPLTSSYEDFKKANYSKLDIENIKDAVNKYFWGGGSPSLVPPSQGYPLSSYSFKILDVAEEGEKPEPQLKKEIKHKFKTEEDVRKWVQESGNALFSEDEYVEIWKEMNKENLPSSESSSYSEDWTYTTSTTSSQMGVWSYTHPIGVIDPTRILKLQPNSKQQSK